MGVATQGYYMSGVVPLTIFQPVHACFCRYVRRRAREGFREAAAVTDTTELAKLWEGAQQQLAVVRRQSVVYDLYSRRHKHAMVGGGGIPTVVRVLRAGSGMACGEGMADVRPALGACLC